MSTRLYKLTVTERDKTERAFELLQGYEFEQRKIFIGKDADGQLIEGWSASIKFAGLVVALREKQRGTIEAEGDHGVLDGAGRPVSRPRTGEVTRAGAVKWAVERITEEHTRRLFAGKGLDTTSHLTGEGLTIYEMFNQIWSRRLFGHATAGVQANYERLRDIFLVVFGTNKRSFTREDIVTFYLQRCGHFPDGTKASKAELRLRGIKNVGVTFPHTMGRKALKATKPYTAKKDLRDAKTLFNYLVGVQDASGRKLIQANPLDGLHFGEARKGRKPVPTVERYRALMRYATAAVERQNELLAAAAARRGHRRHRTLFPPALRCALAIAFHTGQRIDAILHLMLTDFRRTQSQVRAAIRESIRNTPADVEVPSETWADGWVYGALYFRAEWSKMDYDRPVPINAVLLAEIERYLNAREQVGIDSPWFFFDPNTPQRPMQYEDARDLLRLCETVARERMLATGSDEETVEMTIPDLGDQAWHGYRALWENLRDDLGWFMNKNAAWAGGWTTDIGGPQDQSYRRLKPHYIFAVVCGKSVLDVLEDAHETERAKVAITTPIE